MVEKWLEIQLTIWLLTIKIQEIKVKWPLNLSSDTMLEGFFQGLQKKIGIFSIKIYM
jgi:hypothetical protein